jgi:hypothetical protein
MPHRSLTTGIAHKSTGRVLNSTPGPVDPVGHPLT